MRFADTLTAAGITETRSPILSIVIATLDARDGLEATIKSIEAQNSKALETVEVIVVDGGSLDGTPQLASTFSCVTSVISEADRGIYDAMNKGARLARGRWMQFLNAGDRFNDSTALAAVLGLLLEAESEHDTLVICGAEYDDGERIDNLPHNWLNHAMGLQAHCHQAMWFRSDVFRAFGGYSEQFGIVDDFDLILRWGLIGRHREDRAVRIKYERGGVSDQQAARIPKLVAEVRRDRLQLKGYWLLADKTFASSLSILTLTRSRLGRMLAFARAITRSTR